jgi:hypothetical protein
MIMRSDKILLPRLSGALLALFIGLSLAVLPLGNQADASSPRKIGSFQHWDAMKLDDGGETVCFIVSQPQESELSRTGARRGDVFFLVTNWIGAGKKGEPSVIIGYPFQENSQAEVVVGSDTFRMMVHGDTAWLADEADERRLVDAMRRGSSMTVRGVSHRGTRSSDRFSLLGVSAALDRINSECS